MCSDEHIKKEIIDHLYWDGCIDASILNINESGEEITLKGNVTNFTAYGASENDAWSIPEVKGVDNKLWSYRCCKLRYLSTLDKIEDDILSKMKKK